MVIRKAMAIAVSVVLVLTAYIVFSTPALADEPGVWIKTDEVNEITPALTEETASLVDDEASEFIHQIQWAEAGMSELGFTNATDALDWVYNNISYEEDLDNYGVAEAWANPEQTLNRGSGDCEDMAFLLASLLKWHTAEVDIEGGDQVYANCGFLLPPDGGVPRMGLLVGCFR